MQSMKKHLIERPDGDLAVYETGTGSPLILLHGWAMDHRMFQPQFDGLGRYFRMIAPDRRGFGSSSAPPSLVREPDDLLAIMDTLSLHTAHLLGMSQGGRIALRFAASHPERLRSLSLQGAAVDGLEVPEPEQERLPLDEFIALARDNRLPEVKQRWLEHPMMALPVDLAAERKLIEDMVQDYRGLDLKHHDAGHFQHQQDVLSKIDASTIPVLLLTGARESTARKAHADAIIRGIRDARDVSLPASGHLGNLSEPERYNQALADFCSSIDTRRQHASS